MYNEILEFARAFGTPIAAGVGAYVAYRFGSIQASIARTQVEIATRQADTSRDAALTARNKLRMDMYQERLKIYNAVIAMFADFGMSGRLTNELENNYWAGIGSSRWVFGKDMQEFLEGDLWHKMADYVAAHSSYDEHAPPEIRTQLGKAKGERRKELMAMKPVVDQRFAEFMEFERAAA